MCAVWARSADEVFKSELYLFNFIDEIFEKYIHLYFSDKNKFKYGNDELKRIVDCISSAKEFFKNHKTKKFYTDTYCLLSAVTQYKGENYSNLWYISMEISILNEQYFNKTMGFIAYLIFKEISWLDLRYIFDISPIGKAMPNSPEEFKQMINIVKPIEETLYKLNIAYAQNRQNKKLETICKIVYKFQNNVLDKLADDNNPIYHEFDKKNKQAKRQQQILIENKKRLLQTLYFYTYWDKISSTPTLHSNDDIEEIINKKQILSLFKDFNIDDTSAIIKDICRQKKFSWVLDIEFDKIYNFEYAFKALYYVSRDINQNASSLTSLHNLLWDECNLKSNIDKLKNEEGFLIGIGMKDFTNFNFMFDVVLNDTLGYTKKYNLPQIPSIMTKKFDNTALMEKKILFCEQSDYVSEAKHKSKLNDYTNENLINLFSTKDSIHIKKIRILEQHSTYFFDQFLQKENLIHLIKLLYYISRPILIKNVVENIPIAIAHNLYAPLIGTLVSNNFNTGEDSKIIEGIEQEYTKLSKDLNEITNNCGDRIKMEAKEYSEEFDIDCINYKSNQQQLKWINEKSAPMYREIFERVDAFVKYLKETKGSDLEYFDITENKNMTLVIRSLLSLIFANDIMYEKISSKYNLEIGLYLQYLIYNYCSEMLYTVVV
ncbi:MAG: hypothetical protein ATN35_01475 [Epulopiscium sp. Nele67-Bin004]|nr:MAG: hypothetical protein ATN35_01475 [Epulopiscium sp. Nele67-Bin004]